MSFSWVWRKGKLNSCSETFIFNQIAMIRSSLWLIINTFRNVIVLIKPSELKNVWNPTKVEVKSLYVCICVFRWTLEYRENEKKQWHHVRTWKRGGKCLLCWYTKETEATLAGPRADLLWPQNPRKLQKQVTPAQEGRSAGRPKANNSSSTPLVIPHSGHKV